MKKFNVKNNILLLIIFVLIIAITVVGVSYAFYYNLQEGKNNHQMLTGDIHINYSEHETISLINAMPTTKEKALLKNNNYTTFSLSVKNTYDDADIYYTLSLDYGDDVSGRTRIDDKYIKFRLTEIVDGEEQIIIDEGILYDYLNGNLLFDSISRNTLEEVNHTYRLRIWISDEILISDTDSSAIYSTSVFSNSYANVKIKVETIN